MLTRHWRVKFRKIMKEYYIDNWNSMVIPNKIENVEKTFLIFIKVMSNLNLPESKDS